MSNRSLACVLALSLTGCTLFPPMMPELQPAFRREPVSTGSSTCSPNRCGYDITVGPQRFRVETQTRIVSAKELTGANAAERAAAGLLGWGLRRAGFTTFDQQIVVGTRTVTSEGSPWRLECSVAWLDQRERGNDASEQYRITEGIDCEQRPVDSLGTTERWKFRYGVPPVVDSLAAVADTVGFSARSAPVIAPLLSSRGAAVATYSLVDEPFGTMFGAPRSGGWRVVRPDSTTIAALRLPPAFSCVGHCALDFGAASAAEETALRFIAAALMAPLHR